MGILVKIQPLTAMTFQVKSIVLLNGEIFLLPLPAPDTVEITATASGTLLPLTVYSQDDVLAAQTILGVRGEACVQYPRG